MTAASLRVFPRGARFDVPARFDEGTGALGDAPAGLRLRSGATYGPGEDREAQIAALLTVRPAGSGASGEDGRRERRFRVRTARRCAAARGATSEARIEPGDIVTVIGRALPFDQLDDPDAADVLDPGSPLGDDPEIAADLAAARAAGTLLSDPADAWGNAAIPGFGIGRPVREPDLDEAATDPPLATAVDAARYRRTFEIAPDALILAAAPDAPLMIAMGAPSVAAGRRQREFFVGLLGAVVAIASAMAFAVMLGGGLGRMTPPGMAALFAVGMLIVVVASSSSSRPTTPSSHCGCGSTRRGRTSMSPSSSVSTSCRTSSRPSAA